MRVENFARGSIVSASGDGHFSLFPLCKVNPFFAAAAGAGAGAGAAAGFFGVFFFPASWRLGALRVVGEALRAGFLGLVAAAGDDDLRLGGMAPRATAAAAALSSSP